MNQGDANGQYRLAHAMLRVLDLDRSIDFYCGLMGMRVLRQSEYPDGRFTNTFVGYGDEDSHTVIELTYNWDQATPYELGGGFGHLAVLVPDVYAACDRLRAGGANIVREPGPMKHGTRVIAFVADPDGYKVEIIGARAD